ncbi:glycosyl hydrolase family 18 [Colletotrichum salicis]|uniref:chitinase n=1 Tax=Colletotrichum salicis TaxID=1209931 RepID=A0A135UHZ2_9PEZI|nr:glycosyl hydrolase family 18 [Colletotrichum salicis]
MALVHAFARSIAARTLILIFSLHLLLPVLALPSHKHGHSQLHQRSVVSSKKTCLNEAYAPFDYSAKPARDRNLPVCPKNSSLAAVHARDLLLGRQVTQQTDYSCSETKPCGNGGLSSTLITAFSFDLTVFIAGACCPKETGWCNYGPKACGTNGISPNDVCWSNCDAKAECGRYADPPGKECPLNVCCSPWGFCGMTEDFCKISDDEDVGCQSNCEQPDSGASNGNIRKRVIGYYEAWVHERSCNGMSIEQIPVGALTHLMFSFAYITPGEFQIVPMDDLKTNLFTKMAALKSQNKALKVMIALGGWTFNDPGPTQTVFHDVASSKENRAKFIGNLLSFLRQYAFDGVDFDWEYPGAEDRGGSEEDGKNFTLLLEELRKAIDAQPLEYVVSFTTPTSFWYLRHFDIKGSTDAADFVNIMSYDLHGVWDAWNPIGSNVLAHTNITEIKLALDLYWRNDIPPSKLNLGFGFYGRSFQLSDPSCHEPGCPFVAGASPGPCTKNSGTLAYREIVNIIDKHKLTPYYDKEAQAKYIVWNQDQWISYDDEDTIAAKIKFANGQGLGGLLIWSLDQDTDDLSALSAVVGEDTIKLARKSSKADDAAYWQDIGAQNCYVSNCGDEGCKPGFKPIETQPCGSAHWFTRRAEGGKSTLCCPLSAAPDPDDCSWRSSAPECNGRCDNDEVLLQLNKWGDGKYCENGNKAYCCKTALEKKNNCAWGDRGKSCKSGQQPLTFSGTFGKDEPDLNALYRLKASSLASALKDYDLSDIDLYCCPPEDLNRWNNCEWKGKPGNCFDGHCDINTEVQVAWSNFGGAEGCFPRLDRTRIFCCDPPKGENVFLPVPLKDLFPNPPSGDDVDTNFDLKVDSTWGGAESSGSDDAAPGDAAFQFYVLAAPEEISTSLDKRDGSHWEVFNCNNAHSEEEQTVQIICTDDSNDSNCDHIFRGLGAKGTIIQMPQGQGCGPGKYAVVKRLEIASNQTLPKHLVKRKYGSLDKPGAVYDLTFDYDFTRVPRDFGDTQLRVDFSNQENYWDQIVEAPAGKKAKRSLASVGGNHKRWLEEEWREDMHFGALSRDELHKRWFGETVIEWLKGLLDVEYNKEKRHDYEEELQAIILQEEWDCGSFSAKVDAVATAGISMSTSFGFTLITTLGPNMNLDNSFLYFNNEGKIEAIFTLDAIARVDWDSDVFNIVTLPIPGATFNIPGILTVGPRLDLDARFKAGVSVHGRVEARVTVSEWEIRQTYPQQSGEYDPEDEKAPARKIDNNNLTSPSFDASLEADGYAEAHLMPTLVFGIKFNKAKKTFIPKNEDQEWECLTGQAKRDTIESGLEALDRVRRVSHGYNDTAPFSLIGTGLRKRVIPYGPMITLPQMQQLCPTNKDEIELKDCGDIFAGDEMYKVSTEDEDAGSVLKRSVNEKTNEEYWEAADDDVYVVNPATGLHIRAASSKKKITICYTKQGSKKLNGHEFYLQSWDIKTYTILDNEDWGDCNNYEFGIQPSLQQVPNKHYGVRPGAEQFVGYRVEHVLEGNQLDLFMLQNSGLCKAMKDSGWFEEQSIGTKKELPWEYIGRGYPYIGSNDDEFYSILEIMNIIKENAFLGNALPGEKDIKKSIKKEATLDEAIRTVKNAMMTYKYVVMDDVKDILKDQADRVSDRLDTVDKWFTGKGSNPWAYSSMKAKWRSFIKGSTEKAVGKMKSFVVDWTEKIEEVLPKDTTNDANVPGRVALRKKIVELRKAVDDLPAWTSPW